MQSQNQTQPPPPPDSREAGEGSTSDAPPKQVAMAMDRLCQAGRLIADIRLGADRLLEAIFVTNQPHQSAKPVDLFIKEDASIRKHFQDLRSIGRLLEESGVLSESLRSRSNSWGLHMPLVCPDGAVVAYAWKRQLAGQAGASAVDRTRLALKAFTDQKRRFFPHLDDGPNSQTAGTESVSKRRRGSQVCAMSHKEKLSDCRSLLDVLQRMEREASYMKICTYQRLDWLKRASTLPSSPNDNSVEGPKEQIFQTSSSKLGTGPGDAVSGSTEPDKVAVIELLYPSVFRAVLSLHSAGSVDPDAVAFFAPDEGGSYVHARGISTHHVFRHITEHAATALQFFLGAESETALYHLLHWVCSYHTLFTKVCCTCGRLVAMDKQSNILLPPVNRPHREFAPTEFSTAQPSSLSKDQNSDSRKAYHIGCFSEETS